MSEASAITDPELVAVFDLRGTVDDFLRATQRIDGLDFLAELQGEELDPDDEFHYEDEGDVSSRPVPQTLYMAMSDARAVSELVRLFGLWQEDESITFDRGLNPLKRVFGLLHTIRRWDAEDRVRETGLMQQWEEDVAVMGRGPARIEIELWYRTDATARASAQGDVTGVVTRAGGTVLATSQLSAIGYHALLAEIPYDQVARVLADGPAAIELLTSDSTMIVSPSMSMAFPSAEPQPDAALQFDCALPSGPPRVALLDGLPLANHSALAGRLVIDDPDDRAAGYTARGRNHGTAMASIIAHGDLSAPGPALKRPIYVRPLLEPHPFTPDDEITPRQELLVDLVHRAFRRMFEGDGNDGPAAGSVRVVNLSIGDPARMFVRRLSPLARLLDWLSYEYNLVLLISAGNVHDVHPTVSPGALDDRAAREAACAASLHGHGRARHRRLLSPAEAINAVTVGALHADAAAADLPDTVVDVWPTGAPAPYSSVGFGFRRSVKPEVLLPGGAQVYIRPPTGQSEVELAPAPTSATGPGVRVAAPGLSGEADAARFICGTSNATASASRIASGIFDLLEAGVGDGADRTAIDPQYHPVLTKALLVHAASWDGVHDRLRDLLDLSGQAARRSLTEALGYGPVRLERVATADRVRAVLVGVGSIEADRRHTFRFPLPGLLKSSTEWRRLTVTLGWLSPVEVRSQKYRKARLHFAPPRDELAVEATQADHNAVLKGTVQHQVFEGRRATAYLQGDAITIDIDCKADAGSFTEPVRYGLAVSLEVSDRILIDLHQQVRDQLRVELRQPVEGRVRTAPR